MLPWFSSVVVVVVVSSSRIVAGIPSVVGILGMVAAASEWWRVN